MEKENKIVQFQVMEDGDILILLDNGRIFRKTESGGPYYWIEENVMEELIKYSGKELIS